MSTKKIFDDIIKYQSGPILPFYKMFDNSSKAKESTEVVKDEEIKKVKKLIKSGREQGLSEISLTISREMSEKVSAGGGSTIDGIPINVSLDVGADSKGDFILTVRYLEKHALDKIKDLHELHRKSIITDEEFSKAKDKIINEI